MKKLLLLTLLPSLANAGVFVGADYKAAGDTFVGINTGYQQGNHSVYVGLLTGEQNVSTKRLTISDTEYRINKHDADHKLLTIGYAYTFAEVSGMDTFVKFEYGQGDSEVTRTLSIYTDNKLYDQLTESQDLNTTYYSAHVGVMTRTEGMNVIISVGYDSFETETFDAIGGIGANLGFRYTF